LGQKGEPEAAAKEFRFVLSRRPDDLEMYCNLGIVLQQQGKIDEAIDQYRQALQIDPDYGKARQLLQAALEKQKNR
jgi:tetratricopeptide (TPR) repeat protein